MLPDPVVHSFQVIVAGAGLAGLSAGYELACAGAAVTLVDARFRAGGRVHTCREFDANQHGELQIEADYMVMTLPASTLRHVDVQPALPDDQRHAIERLAYGCATKVLLQRSGSLFGERRARAFATDSAVGAFWDASEGEGEQASIVAFLAGGSTSASLRDKADGDGSALLSELCWLGATPAPITAVHIADWTSDPWARGGYAFLDPGFDPAWRPLLTRRAGRMVFAGEHTSERWQGYMNGAVESGQRAARELVETI